METQLNVFGFLTDIPVNSWLPFLHMINLLRLGRSFSSITDEILAGYGNIARQTLAKWRDVYPKALGCALTNLDARMIGGKHHVVVMDETVVGVHAEDGWTGSFLVFDGWRATEKAVNSLGYTYAPPVKHEKHFRDPSTGFHTNDAESENNRLKKWSRTRYGKLQLNASEMDEYVFYVNVGSSLCDVFHGLAMANGGACSNRLLAIE
eukprot:s33_g54.t2